MTSPAAQIAFASVTTSKSRPSLKRSVAAHFRHLNALGDIARHDFEALSLVSSKFTIRGDAISLLSISASVSKESQPIVLETL
jgi:hypothetical protein